MNSSLSSSRYGPADRAGGQSNHSHNSGGRRGGGGGGRGGHHNRRHHPYRREYNDHNDRRGGGGGGGGRSHPPGNRFGGNASAPVDPKTRMHRMLSAMVGRVGELGPESNIPKNIEELSKVLCNPDKAALFLVSHAVGGPTVRTDVDMEEAAPTQQQQVDAQEEAGPLAHCLIASVATLPLQTPTYAGLTLAVHQRVPENFSGFASRCVTYAMRHLSRDLDAILIMAAGDEPIARPMSRVLHILRYLAILARLNIVLGYDTSTTVMEPRLHGLSVAGILYTLTTAATKADNKVGCLLACMVLNTLPYVQDYIPKDYQNQYLLEPLETQVLHPTIYKSTFTPGIGSNALLLKDEQLEGEDEGEEDDDDEEDEDASAQCCDTLQDLLRSVKHFVLTATTASIRFSLLTDAPWQGLTNNATNEAGTEEQLVYTGDPVRLSLSQDCRSIPQLLSDNQARLTCYSLDGIVFGRLPIFGSPSDEDDEDDDDPDTPPNEQLQAYQKGFGLSDRYFLADAVRDCLLCHQSHVSDTGLERGSAKDVAQQIWSISHVFADNQGIEYGMIEAILALIVQSSQRGSLRNLFLSRVLLELTRLQPTRMPQALAVAVSTMVSYYLPSLVPTARENFSRWFAFHLTNTDYQWPGGYWELWSTYVVNGKRNSRGDFVMRTLAIMASQLSSVKILVTDCLPSGSILANHLVPIGASHLGEDNVVGSIEKEVHTRIWEKNEDPDSLRTFMMGDEISESVAGGNMDEDSGDNDKIWWRTGIVIRCLVDPATREQNRARHAIQLVQWPAGDSSIMEEDANDTEDVLTILLETLVRYRPVLLAMLARDAQAHEENMDLRGGVKADEGDILVSGEIYLLKQMEGSVSHSRALLEGCVSCLVENQVISSEAVLGWALGGKDGTGDGTGASILQHWVSLAKLTVYAGVMHALSELEPKSDENEQQGDMILDFGPDDHQSRGIVIKRMKAITDYIDPVMQFALKRACELLQHSGDTKKKFAPRDVDIVEGMKQFVLSTQALVVSVLQNGTTAESSASLSEAHEMLSMSNISGTKLASTCVEDGVNSPALEAMVRIFEAMI